MGFSTVRHNIEQRLDLVVPFVLSANFSAERVNRLLAISRLKIDFFFFGFENV